MHLYDQEPPFPRAFDIIFPVCLLHTVVWVWKASKEKEIFSKPDLQVVFIPFPQFTEYSTVL